MSDDGPKYLPTKQIPKVEVPGNTIDAVLREVRAMRGDVEILVEDGRKTNQRLTRVEERIDELDGRLMRSSSRVRQESDVNLKQEAAIAQVIVEQGEAKKRDEKTQAMLVATQTQLAQNSWWTKALYEDGKTFFKRHPKLETALVGLFLATAAWAVAWIKGGL